MIAGQESPPQRERYGYGEVAWPPGERIVARARRGEPGALAALLTVAYPRLIGFYRVAGLARPDAEDLASDVVEVLLRQVPKLRRARSFEAWFWKVARSRLNSWLRATRRPSPAVAASAAGPGPEETAEVAEEHATIRRALAMVPARDRMLLWLREVEGLSYDEIGGRLQATVGAVRVGCHRARRRLERAYRALEVTPR